MPKVIRQLAERFWAWYERYYVLHVGLTLLLFLWQIVHLYWLGTHVIALRLFGVSYFTPNPFWQTVLILVDYTEIPAIISTSLLYIFELQRKSPAASPAGRWRLIGLLILLNSQWLHLFWITDEFVEEVFLGTGGGTVLPGWLAWVAILIDYLEIPVIFDIVRRFIRALRHGGGWEFIRKELS